MRILKLLFIRYIIIGLSSLLSISIHFLSFSGNDNMFDEMTIFLMVGRLDY